MRDVVVGSGSTESASSFRGVEGGGSLLLRSLFEIVFIVFLADDITENLDDLLERRTFFGISFPALEEEISKVFGT